MMAEQQCFKQTVHRTDVREESNAWYVKATYILQALSTIKLITSLSRIAGAHKTQFCAI